MRGILYQSHDTASFASPAEFVRREARVSDPVPPATVPERLAQKRFAVSEWISGLDLAPDLAEGIGSRRWFRGLATFLGLAGAAIALWPAFPPLEAAPATRLDQQSRDEFRSQMIAPLALGGDSGRRMAALPTVTELKRAPERPQVQLLATLAQGDGFERMLQRAGVGPADASRVAELVGRSIALGDIEPGTKVDITLGRRVAPGQPRPLDALEFRARFDLKLAVERTAGNLAVRSIPIRVDDTPLRIRGTIGDSLYRSARAAGAPASAIQQYLRVLDENMDMERSVQPGDTFDIIVSHRRAATGERQAGKLIYAGIDRGGKPLAQLMRWGSEGRFYEASGVGERRSGLLAPVPGAIGSRYGMRRHPILGYKRMHWGLDFRGGHGTPIVAVTDGIVASAGREGGCGNTVRLNHAGALQTRYCHMSRMAVNSGQQVRRGQVIGYIGSTGLSTGPHLHYEMRRNGRAVDPQSVSYVTRAELEGAELQRFRDALAKLKTVEAGSALTELTPTAAERGAEAPRREVDKLDRPDGPA
ncbi:M23 family metallopeptidase [Qipengyuania sp. JC766]|uniref:M23 family metallopeptidase n=1 Tax=Qipengyuania sp. JC766 TaxID=3232139 RepID=UPI003458B10B